MLARVSLAFAVTTGVLIALPALADNGHSGVATPRTGPELSDVALFVMAAIGVWVTRRALRRRHPKG